VSPTKRIAVDGGGVWVVRSASPTVYFVDLNDMLLLRQPASHTTAEQLRGPFDGSWVPLTSVISWDVEGVEHGVLRVGARHRYDTDPDPNGVGDYRWWLQRMATEIDSVPPELRPIGAALDIADYARPLVRYAAEEHGRDARGDNI